MNTCADKIRQGYIHVVPHHLMEQSAGGPSALPLTDNRPKPGVIQRQRNHANRYMASNKLNRKINQQQNRQVARHEAGAPQRAKKKLKKQQKKKRKEGQKKAWKNQFMGLGKDKAWKEVIDGSFHDLGPGTFDEGLHDADPEPGYLGSMMKAREYVGNTMGTRVDAQYLERVHELSASHKNEEEDYHGGYRTEDDTQISVAYRAKEDVDSEEGDYVKGDPEAAIRELDPNVTRAFHDKRLDDEDYNPDENIGKTAPATLGSDANLLLWFKTKKAAQVKDEVNKIMGSYYAQLKRGMSREESLLLIATTHRKLENLHPFIDANTRTNRLILHKMLVENGMSPVILDNPLEVHLKSNAEWAGVLEEGMQKWQEAKK